MDFLAAHMLRQREQTTWSHTESEGGSDATVPSTAQQLTPPCSCGSSGKNNEAMLECALVTIDVLRGKLVSGFDLPSSCDILA